MIQKRILAFVLLLIIFVNSQQIRVEAVTVTNKVVIGDAVRLLDGEVIAFHPIQGDEIWNLKLIGIDTKASEEAYEFVKSNIMGNILVARVQLDDQGNYYRDDAGYYYGHLYINNKNINEMLMENGLVDLNEEHKDLNGYAELENKYLFAKENEHGKFGKGAYFNPYTKKVNIQTATSSELEKILVNTDYDLASLITKYVKENKINKKDELKFIDPRITNEWLEINNSKLSVMTNINTAEENELRSLFYSYKEKDIVNRIIERRLDSPFTDVEQLKDIKDLSDTFYDKIKHYVGLEYYTSLVDPAIKVVNINTASESQLKEIEDLSDNHIDRIIKYRNHYSYKTKEEIKEYPSGMSTSTFNKFEDSFTLYTDVNKATLNELESVFGSVLSISSQRRLYANAIKRERPFKSISEIKEFVPSHIYNQISPYIYVNELKRPTQLNVNLATKTQVMSFFDFTSSEASKFMDYQDDHRIEYFGLIDKKFDMEEHQSKVALYTNINEATSEELMLLHKDMNKYIVNKIIEYREDHVFGNKDEFKMLLSAIKNKTIYKDIERYIVVR